MGFQEGRGDSRALLPLAESVVTPSLTIEKIGTPPIRKWVLRTIEISILGGADRQTCLNEVPCTDIEITTEIWNYPSFLVMMR